MKINVKQLIEKGDAIPPSILWGAVYWCRPEVVDLLLSAGVDPNRRHAKAEEIMTMPQLEPDWLDRDPDRTFHTEMGTCFPVLLAAYPSYDEEEYQKRYHMVRSLLRHGADPYAIFAKQLEDMDFVDEARSLFPGEDLDQPKDDIVLSSRHQERIENILGPDFVGIIPPLLTLDFGLCCVIHSVLRSNCRLRPFFGSPEFMRDLKLEHRCPLGRTLFLSACRNVSGADAPIDRELRGEVDWRPGLGYDSEYNSDARAAFPPGICSTPHAKGAQPKTAIQLLLNLGADPLATDNQGKNALHQMLEAHIGDYSQPATIRQSLRHLTTRFPSLINQWDRNGMSPIHKALRRLWKYTSTQVRMEIGFAPPEDCVLDLIEAGADVRARDAQNNTVLHYLADGYIDALELGEHRRQLFYMLLDKCQCAPDINTPNNLGQTPIQLMLCYTKRKEEWHHDNVSSSPHVSPDLRHVDVELFGKFDQAGVDWMVRDKFGRTLLHNVVQTRGWDPRTEWRCEYLIQKGIDPLARDFEGKTARDLAPPRQGKGVLDLLAGYADTEVLHKPSDAVDKVHVIQG
ncbi:ankyrin repeat-containing domain protein [Trichoderma ceciliae]